MAGSLLLALAGAVAMLMPGQAVAPATVAPLAVSAACHVQGDVPSLLVRLENRSAQAITVVLGRHVGTERTPVVDSLFVMATRLATGAAEDFIFVNPKHAMLAGATEPWTVSLPAGGSYEIDAPIRYFVSRLNYSFLEPLGLPGTRLLFDAKPLPPGPAASPKASVWAGQLEVPIVPCG